MGDLTDIIMLCKTFFPLFQLGLNRNHLLQMLLGWLQLPYAHPYDCFSE